MHGTWTLSLSCTLACTKLNTEEQFVWSVSLNTMWYRFFNNTYFIFHIQTKPNVMLNNKLILQVSDVATTTHLMLLTKKDIFSTETGGTEIFH